MTSVVARPTINVLDPEFYVDPWAAYRWLRDEEPCFWDPVQQMWALSRYEDIRTVEKDDEHYSSYEGSRPQTDQSDDGSMINLNDPEHQQQRSLVFRRFTPRAIRTHEEHVRSVVTEILDKVVDLGECEAIDAIASPLPAIMIGDFLGYPRELWPRVRFWSEQTMHLSGQTSPSGPPHLQDPSIGSVVQEYAQITLDLIQQRRDNPQDDLISIWTHTEGWDDKRVLEETLLLLDGGAETTRTVIGSIIRELALQPDQRELLIERPELLKDTAVEEFIRWVSPLSNMRRTAVVDQEMHGQTIKAGDQVLLLYGSANRDPREFENPDVFDVTRSHNRHIAFGFGTHVCLGAHLARLEIRVMFEELLRRMPHWELVDPDEPKILPATFARAYDRIRIRWS
jgi:cytochrome P450 family 142 subfamily A polypeptide 1